MTALLLVDLQNDFLPGGALAVPDGHDVLPVARSLMSRFDVVVATQDWHPANHGSFAAGHGRSPGDLVQLNGLTQVLWPTHCVQGEPGAAFAPGLDPDAFTAVFQKGMDPGVDSYSGFYDNGQRHSTGLAEWLRGRGVERLVVMGLATDYCVKCTALDARALGFSVDLVVDGCRAVNLAPGDGAAALDEMQSAGVRLCHSGDLS